MPEPIHQLDPTTASYPRWAGSEPQEIQPLCVCGAPWRARDCDARRDERVTAPFSAQAPMTKIFIVLILGTSAAAVIAAISAVVRAASWVWP